LSASLSGPCSSIAALCPLVVASMVQRASQASNEKIKTHTRSVFVDVLHGLHREGVCLVFGLEDEECVMVRGVKRKEKG